MADERFAELRSGDRMPLVGLGTWKSKRGEVQAAVEAAIDAGYRHIDCASVYQNEEEVGAAFKNKIGSAVSRKDLWVTSKLWNNKHHTEDVVPALKQTLKDLGLEYVDLYLIHWPTAFKRGEALAPKDENGKVIYDDVSLAETWKGMEEAVSLGLAKNIGVSNFNHKQLQQIIDAATIQPSMLQVECHPYLNQSKLLAWCTERGIRMTAYSPLGSPDRPWAKPDDPSLLQDPRILEIAGKYNKSAAQVLIRFQVQRGVCVIPKSVSPERIKANLDVFDFKLSDEEMAAIEGFNRDHRFVVPGEKDHPQFPFNEEF